jgi:hypothetical protein
MHTTTQPPPVQAVTMAQAMSVYECSSWTVRRMIERGELQATRRPGSGRIIHVLIPTGAAPGKAA